MPIKYASRPDNSTGLPVHDVVVSFNYDILGDVVDTWLFIADCDYEVVRIAIIPTIAGTNGSAVTADIVKASGTTAAASGVTVLSAADSFDLKGTINTLQIGTLTPTLASKRLTLNDRLGVNFTGTLTAAVGLIQINLKRINDPASIF